MAAISCISLCNSLASTVVMLGFVTISFFRAKCDCKARVIGDTRILCFRSATVKEGCLWVGIVSKFVMRMSCEFRLIGFSCSSESEIENDWIILTSGVSNLGIG